MTDDALSPSDRIYGNRSSGSRPYNAEGGGRNRALSESTVSEISETLENTDLNIHRRLPNGGIELSAFRRNGGAAQ